MQDFDSMYSSLCLCLDEIAKNIDMVWDGKTVTEAQGLLYNISSPAFTAAFKVNLHTHCMLVTPNHLVVCFKGQQLMLLQPIGKFIS